MNNTALEPSNRFSHRVPNGIISVQIIIMKQFMFI